jgi:hypothetical protein
MRCLRLSLITLLLLAGRGAPAAEYYVSPQGSPTAQGSREAPWDLGSTLAGGRNVMPGDTVWVLRGTYKAPFKAPGMGF